MKKLLLSSFAAIACLGAFAAAPSSLYVIGNIDGADWQPASSPELTETADGIFSIESVTFTASSGTCYFSFTSVSTDVWDDVNANRYFPTSDVQAVTLDADTPFQDTRVEDGPDSWTVPNGTYAIEVDFNTMTFTVTEAEEGNGGNGGEVTPGPGPETSIEAPAQLYLIGGPAGWDYTEWENYELEMVEDGVFAIKDVVFGDNLYFAFTATISDDWNEVNANRVAPAEKDAIFNPAAGNQFSWGVDASWQLEEAGTYSLYVNFNTMLAATSLEAGVKSLTTNNGEEVIYNLQGVRVNRNNMPAGIYIINGKKVAVK